MPTLARPIPLGQNMTCPICEDQFVKRNGRQKFCSERCQKRDERTRYATVTVDCAWCGKCLMRTKIGPSGRAFCTMSCQKAYTVCILQGKDRRPWPRTKPCTDCGVDYPTKSKNKRGSRCPGCRRADAPKVRERPLRFVAGFCRDCGESFIVDRKRFMPFGFYCSERCATRASKNRRRARKRGGYVEDVCRSRIYERDGYRCQICGGLLAMTKQAPHPKSPSIDHIIPLARGGTHEYLNCQAAHFLCNASKSDAAAPRGDQLLLLG